MSLANMELRFAPLAEPAPDEPFAPVFDFDPLPLIVDRSLPLPGDPDPLVFGVPLTRSEVYAGEPLITRTRRPCQVGWAGLTECWYCGPPA